MPQAALTCSMTSGLSGSPALMSSLMRTGQADKILLDQHPPHRRRRAKSRDAATHDGVEQPARIEAALIDDEHRRLRIPRRKETAPGVLGPARRRNVEMHVAGPQPEPIHRRQMADRIALMAVQDELGRRRGAGGEIEQQRIVRPRFAVRRELRGRLIAVSYDTQPGTSLPTTMRV